MRDAQILVGVWFWIVNYHVRDCHFMMHLLWTLSRSAALQPAYVCHAAGFILEQWHLNPFMIFWIKIVIQ